MAVTCFPSSTRYFNNGNIKWGVGPDDLIDVIQPPGIFEVQGYAMQMSESMQAQFLWGWLFEDLLRGSSYLIVLQTIKHIHTGEGPEDDNLLMWGKETPNMSGIRNEDNKTLMRDSLNLKK